MIKKFIFSLAIILSLTTHHAVGMDNEEEPLDLSTTLAQPGKLDERHREGRLDADPSCWSTIPGGMTYLGTDPIEQLKELKELEKKLRDLLLIVSLD
ncbi:MAG: hypothetical protein K2X28_03100 [Alphaproteobacteria bacterium]|nr:hypothetical protein [Alphaproteobacteria bacterium]